MMFSKLLLLLVATFVVTEPLNRQIRDTIGQNRLGNNIDTHRKNRSPQKHKSWLTPRKIAEALAMNGINTENFGKLLLAYKRSISNKASTRRIRNTGKFVRKF